MTELPVKDEDQIASENNINEFEKVPKEVELLKV